MKRIIIFFGILIICLALGEVLLHIIYYIVKGETYYSNVRFTEGKGIFVRDPDLGYRSAPNLIVKRPKPPGLTNAPRRQMFYDIDTDSHGFRYSEPLESPKPEGEVRIFCLGGSTTYGAEVPNKFTYPQQLNDLFNDPLIKVVNAGVGGYRSIHLLRYYEKIIRPLEPDIITIYCGWNDYEDFLFSYWKPYDPHGHCLISQFEEVSSPLRYLITGRLVLKAYYKIIGYNRLEGVSEYDRLKFIKNSDNPVWRDEHRKNLQTLIDDALSDGCLPVLIGFPAPHFADAPQEAKIFADADLNMDQRWDAFIIALEAIRQNLRDLSKKNGIPLIDVNASFEKLNNDYQAKFKLFVDRMHLTKEGNTLIAQSLYPEMKKIVDGLQGAKISKK